VAKPPLLIGIVGWKNSGKTTLVERVVPILVQQGFKVATVKHTHHDLRPPDSATDGERPAPSRPSSSRPMPGRFPETARKMRRRSSPTSPVTSPRRTSS